MHRHTRPSLPTTPHFPQVSGSVDQSGAMISEDVAAKGYALLCVAQPMSDCKFQTIPEVRVCAGCCSQYHIT